MHEVTFVIKERVPEYSGDHRVMSKTSLAVQDKRQSVLGTGAAVCSYHACARRRGVANLDQGEK